MRETETMPSHRDWSAAPGAVIGVACGAVVGVWGLLNGELPWAAIGGFLVAAGAGLLLFIAKR